MTRRVLSYSVSLVLIGALSAPIARAQAPVPQTNRSDASSQELNGFLDLAKLYAAQGRFDEAAAMLTRAQGVVTRMRTAMATIDTPTTLNRTLPPGVVRVGGDIKAPYKIHDVVPIYPPTAKAAKIQGIVLIEVIIDTEGNVTDATVLRSVQLLDESALQAVRQWKFTPTLLNGVPVSVAMTVTVNYSIPK